MIGPIITPHAPDRHRLGPARAAHSCPASPPATSGNQRRAEHALQQNETAPSGLMSCANPHSTEAMVKPAEQMMKIRLRPKRLAIPAHRAAVMIAAAHDIGGQHPVDLVLRWPRATLACRAARHWRWWWSSACMMVAVMAQIVTMFPAQAGKPRSGAAAAVTMAN